MKHQEQHNQSGEQLGTPLPLERSNRDRNHLPEEMVFTSIPNSAGLLCRSAPCEQGSALSSWQSKNNARGVGLLFRGSIWCNLFVLLHIWKEWLTMSKTWACWRFVGCFSCWQGLWSVQQSRDTEEPFTLQKELLQWARTRLERSLWGIQLFQNDKTKGKMIKPGNCPHG